MKIFKISTSEKATVYIHNMTLKLQLITIGSLPVLVIITEVVTVINNQDGLLSLGDTERLVLFLHYC